MEKIYLIGLAGIAAIVLSIFLIVGANSQVNSVGENLGTTTGSMVGSVAGMVNGLAIDAGEGFSKGTEQGLSAKDTSVTIKESCERTGSLQVMTATAQIQDFNTFADSYKDITVLMGDLVFSVDLKEAVVLSDTDGYVVQIPHPTPEFYVDESRTKTLAMINDLSWKSWFSNDVAKGIEGTLNSRRQLKENFKSAISNYAFLESEADSAALLQVKSMLDSFNVGEKKIKKVTFIETEEDVDK